MAFRVNLIIVIYNVEDDKTLEEVEINDYIARERKDSNNFY